ncbi:glyoxylate/hydroxypyruvate reductase GhrA [Xenorhabdus nematophila]|uniref:glyoxylate/hydroxypyruvate reductase GhrA n=1 Tax=Xenorhabdus nematophila TaxID=628 RepID=UPI000543D367|nr:glyoxylate/hydroxypyruvate reductase GhrA [Xenorhabdus nematophila]CEF30383.1 2-ketoacid reductase [Xenorhabdus nematophila str. Websteri]AYA40319.1 glyoxylate/hydroxypyruvate reductase GhrA [Xenorhabdus nematophila]KHD28750.1 bifunctional glyoxylate/hydroxypyruvate reductase A [Xenorhabdus nematophila]MBA0018991.1 glyoxylate/hydroxypyruvate reductase GhrA [Xenorhabdus nematophila]MCB4424390.1 glyoxylate/hydroxypyruvate reductase GhrA [Xenorhabdus nematophila]
MNIIFFHPSFNADEWIQGMQTRLPEAKVRQWIRGDNASADYALVWFPPYEMLANRQGMKGIFVLGAGVDSVLKQELKKPGTFPAGVPLIRLEDAGMAQQMQEYTLTSVLHYFRRMDEYKQYQEQRLWKPLAPHNREEFVIGVLGAGILGCSIMEKLKEFDFNVRCWSRTPKHIENIESFYGKEQLGNFLSECKVLINVLPDTPETRGILNLSLFSQLKPGSYVINVARGAQLAEQDLLVAIDKGYVAGATLDVFVEEPLSNLHPFWTHPRINITPHIAANTIPDGAMDAICENIRRMENGEQPSGLVDITRGY